MNSADYLKLYLVTDRRCLKGGFLTVVKDAVRGGVTAVQLREKDISDEEFVVLGKQLKSVLEGTDVPLILNDRVHLVKETGADGVHLGQSDMSVSEARGILGKDAIIGLSVENLSQAKEANEMDVDYIAVSPVFSTPTKTDTAPAMGLEGLRDTVQMSVRPVIGIGGINETNISEVMKTGAAGVAVVSAIMNVENPCEAARNLRGRI